MVKAQELSTAFSDSEIESYVKTVIATKSQYINHDSMIIATLQEVNLSQERYGQILKAKIAGQEIQLTSDETVAIKAIQQKDQVVRQSKALFLEQKCQANAISKSTFEAIKKQSVLDGDLKKRINNFMTQYRDNK